MNRGISRLAGPVLAMAGVLTLPLAFIHSSWIMARAQDLLGWKVSQRFTGGQELARFYDPVGDDHGEGNLDYPLASQFAKPGILDLVRYSVYRPLTNPAWSGTQGFWQLGLGLACLDLLPGGQGFNGPVIHIYIDLDKAAGGSVLSLEPRSELVDFDPAHPWDVCVCIDPSRMEATLEPWDRSWKRHMPLVVDAALHTVYVRLPLDTPQTRLVLDGRPTSHYVLLGAYDPYARGNFMVVKAKAGLSNGGGATSPDSCRVYDCLCPPGSVQEGMLAPNRRLVEAVEVAAWDPWSDTRGGSLPLAAAVLGMDPGLMDRLAQEADAAGVREEDRRQQAALDLDTHPPRDQGLLAAGITRFEAGQIEAAVENLKEYLTVQPDHPRALAYLGAAIASQGGQARSPGEAIRLVEDGFVQMDKALEASELLARESPALCAELLVVRASVSLAVPDDVFAKARSGARDFIQAAGLLEALDREWAARCLARAGLCLEAAKAPDEAVVLFQRAAALEPEDPWTRLQILRRGLALAGP